MLGIEELNKRDLENLFYKIGERLQKQGELIDVTIYGGSALLLKGLRCRTKDVDAMFDKWDEHNLSIITNNLAHEHKLEKKWFNNDIEPFISEKESLELYKKYPEYGNGGIRIHLPKPDYLLALQVRALSMCHPTGNPNEPLGKHALDVQKLVNILGYDKEKTIETVKIYYSESVLTPVVLKWLELTLQKTEMEHIK